MNAVLKEPARLEIRPSLPGDTWLLANRVRKADVDELWAGLRYTPEQAIRYGLQHSSVVRTAFIEGEAAAIYGVVPREGAGIPWAVFTTTIDRHALTFLRGSRRELESMREGYDRLVNVVDARNTLAVRWLQWLGFALDEPVPYGPDGVLFHRFWWRRV